MSAIKQQERTPKQLQNNRQLRIGKWTESLKTSDVYQIWAELHRIVSSHPSVRASRTAGLLIEEGKQNAY